MGRLDGKVALITGGARGNGYGISQVFVTEGAKVAMMGRTQEWGDEAVVDLTAAGGDVLFVRGDVALEADVERAVAETVEHFGALQLVVNNAGATTGQNNATLVDMKLEDWRRYFEINIDGPFLMCKHAIPHMLEAGYGSIVNVSSNAAIRAGTGTAYSASKSAIHGLTMAVACNYGPVVRCNELVIGHLHPHNPDNPIYQYMEQVPEIKAAMDANYMVGRVGRPEDLGHLSAFFGVFGIAEQRQSGDLLLNANLDFVAGCANPVPRAAGGDAVLHGQNFF